MITGKDIWQMQEAQHQRRVKLRETRKEMREKGKKEADDPGFIKTKKEKNQARKNLRSINRARAFSNHRERSEESEYFFH